MQCEQKHIIETEQKSDIPLFYGDLFFISCNDNSIKHADISPLGSWSGRIKLLLAVLWQYSFISFPVPISRMIMS